MSVVGVSFEGVSVVGVSFEGVPIVDVSFEGVSVVGVSSEDVSDVGVFFEGVFVVGVSFEVVGVSFEGMSRDNDSCNTTSLRSTSSFPTPLTSNSISSVKWCVCSDAEVVVPDRVGVVLDLGGVVPLTPIVGPLPVCPISLMLFHLRSTKEDKHIESTRIV